MKLGYVIVYVADVAASLAFYEAAFGLKRRMLTPEGDYGELDTGATTLAFAAQALAETHSPGGFVYAGQSVKPLGVEVALVTDDVVVAHRQALARGAREIAAPAKKPWGQGVAYIRCPDGSLVELCTPVT